MGVREKGKKKSESMHEQMVRRMKRCKARDRFLLSGMTQNGEEKLKVIILFCLL